jgi:K+-transporting ATPase KdpC subunit
MPSAIFGRHLVASVVMLLAVTLGFGSGYPLVVTGLSQLFFHHQANGSLIYVHGQLTGPALLGQEFTDGRGHPLPRYFQPRPSDAGAGYDGSSSGASSLGPSNPLLIKLVAQRAIAYRHARTRATLDTAGPTFAVFLLGVIVIVGGLIYFPMLILGPTGERFTG